MRSRLRGRWKRVMVVTCAVLLLLGAGVWALVRTPSKQVTAYFAAAVGVYAGSDVRVLGVPVGTVEEVLPQGERVRVTMSIDGDLAVPAEAGAVVVSPSVVSDCYVQLTPVYCGGARMDDGAVIPQDRTATPAEIDQLTRSLDELLVALGPSGANAQGELSELLNTGAANLGRNGPALRDTLQKLSEAGKTLSGSEEDLFGTVEQLQKFTSMLAANDGEVERINGQLAEVASFLAGEREDLGGALHELTAALGQVQSFVQENRALVRTNVHRLSGISQVLVDQRASLEEALDNVPQAFDRLLDAYNPETGTWDSRTNLNELSFGAARQLCASDAGAVSPSMPTFCGSPPAGGGAADLPLPLTVEGGAASGEDGDGTTPFRQRQTDAEPWARPRRADRGRAGDHHDDHRLRRGPQPLRGAAARRSRTRGAPVPGHGGLRRRARPGPAGRRQGRRRAGRQGRADQPARPRVDGEGDAAAQRRRPVARQRGRTAAPVQPAR